MANIEFCNKCIKQHVTKAPYIDAIWDLYLEWAKEHKKTWKDDQIRYRLHIKPHLGNQRMDAIRPFDVEAVLSAMRKKKRAKPYAPATIKHVLVIVKRLYNWSIKSGLYEGPNPAEKIESPKFDNRQTEFLTEPQLADLMAVVDKWPNRIACLIVKFALHTGMRQGEILSLKWRHVGLNDRFVTIANSKGVVRNTLPLSKIAVDILEQAKMAAPVKQCEYCFPNRFGEKRTDFQKIWQRMRKAAGMPHFRFHGLRHTFATYLASSGKVDIYTLQRLLTHKSSKMTQRYAHLMDKALRRGVDVAGEVLPSGKMQKWDGSG